MLIFFNLLDGFIRQFIRLSIKTLLLSVQQVAQEEDLNIVCYERTDFIGGLWKYHDEDDPRLASVTRSTIINSSKEMSSYTDYPPPAHFANYMHNSLMVSFSLSLSQRSFNSQAVSHSLSHTCGNLW